jgi:acyl carrier protein
MTQTEIRQKLLEIAIHEKVISDGELPTGELAAELDSIQRLTLMVAIEDHFQICFEPEEEEALTGVDDLVALIAQKVRS